MRVFILYSILLISILGFAQEKASLEGKVLDSENEPVVGAFIYVAGEASSVQTSTTGAYKIAVPTNKAYVIVLSYFDYTDKKERVPQPAKSVRFQNFIISKAHQYQSVDVKGRKDPPYKPSVIIIKPREMQRFPIPGGFERIISFTGLGVNAGGGELSSGYNVRGGNFDENLVYVNDIPIYRPFLARSGQQEGLSIINSDLVRAVEFSAGGFEAKYGDKLSSVLDIKYVKPDSFRSTIKASFLGGSVHIEGVGREGKRRNDDRFSYLVGARYRSNQYLLGSLDVQGDYQPVFFDVQALLSYKLNSKMDLSYLVSVARNRYLVAPQSQQTSFGNINSALSLFVAFGGQELMQYTTLVNGVNLTARPNKSTVLKLIGSTYNTQEREHFTVEGAYRLSELENNLASDNFGNEKRILGFGYFIDHARNDLRAQVYNVEHKGKNYRKKSEIEWGLGYTKEIIEDRLKEWRYNDSSEYNITTVKDTSNNNQILLDEFLKADITLNSYRLSAYLQHNVLFSKASATRLNYGIRTNYWSYNNENVISPRAQFSWSPNKRFNDSIPKKHRDSLGKQNWILKAAAGYYYQPPFYRELRNLQGQLNPNLLAQKSIHFVLGGDLSFDYNGRPMRFVAETYYKHLDRMVPYIIDNVRIRYLAENSSQGYAAGLDARVNGEFIDGVESWFNFSLMQTKERIYYTDENGDEQLSDWLRRPTDQRVNFSILFQDELPSNPSYKMNLNLVVGSAVPFYFDGNVRYQEGFKIPAYRRVDIGFSKVLVDGTTRRRPSWMKNSESLWASLEIFNLLQINNTISYVLVKDFQNNVYGVPNYLTGRRLNLRFILKI